MIKALTLLQVFFFCAALSGATIWVDRNNYTTGGGFGAGDIIVVNVLDVSSFQFELSMKNGENGSVESSPDMTITAFLPKISSSKNIKDDNTTKFNGKGKISFSIATQVQNRQGDGKLVVGGNRIYSFNGVTNTVTVTGIVDPALVKGRDINSSDVANLRIEIRGRREGLQLQVPQLGAEEKANFELTEQQKQQMIIDYIQKMINEQTR